MNIPSSKKATSQFDAAVQLSILSITDQSGPILRKHPMIAQLPTPPLPRHYGQCLVHPKLIGSKRWPELFVHRFSLQSILDWTKHATTRRSSQIMQTSEFAARVAIVSLFNSVPTFFPAVHCSLYRLADGYKVDPGVLDYYKCIFIIASHCLSDLQRLHPDNESIQAAVKASLDIMEVQALAYISYFNSRFDASPTLSTCRKDN